MAGREDLPPKWFWGILAAVGTALLGACISWMFYISLQIMYTAGDTKEIKSQLVNIRADQVRQETASKDLQTRLQALQIDVTKNESRIESQAQEMTTLREKVYGPQHP